VLSNNTNAGKRGREVLQT